MECVHGKNTERQNAPKFVFGHDDGDENERERNGQNIGAETSMFDFEFGHRISTKFEPKLIGFIDSIDTEFKPLAQHLLRGQDVVIPAPSSSDLERHSERYSEDGRQAILHDIGTGHLLFDYLQYIQYKIDGLQAMAESVEYEEYYGFTPPRPPALEMTPDEPEPDGQRAMLEMEMNVTPHTIDTEDALKSTKWTKGTSTYYSESNHVLIEQASPSSTH